MHQLESFKHEPGIATFICYKKELLPNLKYFSLAGFKLLELWGIPSFGNPSHFPYKRKVFLEKFKKEMEKYGLIPYSVHTPFHFDISHPNKEKRSVALKEIKECIEICSSLDSKVAVVHPGGKYNNDTENIQVENSIDSLLRILEFSSKRGIKIVVENMLPGALGNKMEHIEKFYMSLPEEIGFCVDIGHAYNSGILPSIFKVLGKRVKHLHIQDAFLGEDSHLIPGEGEIKWDNVLDSLRKINYSGVILFEIREREDISLENHLHIAYEKAEEIRKGLGSK